MTYRLTRRLVGLLLGCSICAAAGLDVWGQDKPALEGTWQGTLDLGVAKLRLVL
jgi:hypothetical protein